MVGQLTRRLGRETRHVSSTVHGNGGCSRADTANGAGHGEREMGYLLFKQAVCRNVYS